MAEYIFLKKKDDMPETASSQCDIQFFRSMSALIDECCYDPAQNVIAEIEVKGNVVVKAYSMTNGDCTYYTNRIDWLCRLLDAINLPFGYTQHYTDRIYIVRILSAREVLEINDRQKTKTENIFYVLYPLLLILSAPLLIMQAVIGQYSVFFTLLIIAGVAAATKNFKVIRARRYARKAYLAAYR